MTRRRPMTMARKRRIHEAAGGRCYHCGLPVPMKGPDVRYDHVVALWIRGDDSDQAIKPAHTACDKPKTAADQKAIAKVKRIIARREGTRRERQKIPNRGFDKTRTRGLDGKVRPRRSTPTPKGTVAEQAPDRR